MDWIIFLKQFHTQTEKQLRPKINLSQQEYFEGDIMLPKRPIGGIQRSALYEYEIWPTTKIPYVISKEFSMIIQLF